MTTAERGQTGKRLLGQVPELPVLSSPRWSGFLLCALAMLLVIFPMFAFPKKLPPRHKKKKRRKKLSLDDMSSDDDVLKEKSNNKSQPVTSSMGFGKDIKGQSSSSPGPLRTVFSRSLPQSLFLSQICPKLR